MILKNMFITKIYVCIFLNTSYQYIFWDLNRNPWWPLGIYFSLSWYI
jgi:hypothetical protein